MLTQCPSVVTVWSRGVQYASPDVVRVIPEVLTGVGVRLVINLFKGSTGAVGNLEELSIGLGICLSKKLFNLSLLV